MIANLIFAALAVVLLRRKRKRSRMLRMIKATDGDVTTTHGTYALTLI